MALTADHLVDGQLPNSKTTLYTAAATVIVKSITLVNTDASARTVNIYFKRATSRRVTPKDLSLAVGAAYYDETVRVLEAGDVIEGDASAATVIDYWIDGAVYS